MRPGHCAQRKRVSFSHGHRKFIDVRYARVLLGEALTKLRRSYVTKPKAYIATTVAAERPEELRTATTSSSLIFALDSSGGCFEIYQSILFVSINDIFVDQKIINNY